MVIGSHSMAPEQLSGDPAADHRVDIYAGPLGYELAASCRCRGYAAGDLPRS
jgi:hypothetical protein